MTPAPAPRLDMTSLRWSIAVASAGGFRKAADALGVEQSALSRRVRALEDELGVSLFHRGPGGAALTFAGAAFVASVETALAVLSEAVADARDAGRGRRGRLRIGLTPSFLSAALYALLARFRDAHPEVQIELIAGEAQSHLAAVADRRLDLAVLPGGMTVSGLDVSELWREPLHIVLPRTHPLARADRIDLEDLASQTLLVSQGDVGDDVLGRTPSKAALRIKVVGAGLAVLAAQVELGLGLAVVASGALDTSILPPGLTHRPLCSGDGLTVGFAAAWYHRNDNPALRRFVSSARRFV